MFYLGFPLRGLRWALLIRGTGFPLRLRDATEIIFISWLVNCLVPAKLGDLYRAYLLKINSTVSLQPDVRDGVHRAGPRPLRDRRPGPGLPATGASAGGLPDQVQVVFLIGVVVVIVLAGGLLTMRNFGRRVILALPLPHRVIEFYDRFEEGVFSARRACARCPA